ncbi:MAG: hypothetical protein LBU62_00635 [Bacteroidales bacterium]|jgi:mannosyltransferase OCH1-like enzyme|nr:hypothetical protein [Bacteroidales bacterium]
MPAAVKTRKTAKPTALKAKKKTKMSVFVVDYNPKNPVVKKMIEMVEASGFFQITPFEKFVRMEKESEYLITKSDIQEIKKKVGLS